ncbi:MAG: hypothetical protein ACAI34_14470 [Verrucomicrobium sp.]
MNSKATLRNLSGAFSLVEVTLALGVVSVALLSIVGLLGSAMDTSRVAGKDTALAAMGSQVLGELRSVPFDALGQADPRTAAQNAAQLPEIIAGADLAESRYFFTNEGVPLASSGADAQYECVVRKFLDADSASASSDLTHQTINRLRVILHFTWPVSSSADPLQRPGSSLLNASIARY